MAGNNGNSNSLAKVTGSTTGVPGVIASGDWNRAAEQFGAFKIKGDQLQHFSQLDGSDVEPWDTLLSLLAGSCFHACTHQSREKDTPPLLLNC